MNKGDVFMPIEKEFYYTDEHIAKFPTVRVKKIEINNFKSVDHGEIIFNCGKQFIPYGTKPDILAIYGQNGSGKTAAIEALAVLESILSGEKISSTFCDCISVGADFARLLFVFDLQYPSGEVRELHYSFCLGKKQYTAEEIHDKYSDVPEEFNIPNIEFKSTIFNEILKLSWTENGDKKILQTIIDTSTKKLPFEPESKLRKMVKEESYSDLEYVKREAYENSKSFVFSTKTLDIFKESEMYSVFFQVLIEMRYYGNLYLFVLSTKSSGFIRLNFMLPIYTREGVIRLDVKESMNIPDEPYILLCKQIESLSNVLSQIIPGLRIKMSKINDTIMKDGAHGNVTMLMAERDGIEFPLSYESDGVRKIISELSLLIAVFNDQSMTLAIDEFDAGVFEYLLGEIVQSFQESGKGQFIFTSHNLRPLELLDKSYIIFTTTNPKNRYYRLKGVGQTNNLRDLYFREILMCEQDELLYNKTKRFKIVSEIRKTGYDA